MMTVSRRDPDRVLTVPGPRGRPWVVYVYYGSAPHAWERADAVFVRMMLPRVEARLGQQTTRLPDAAR